MNAKKSALTAALVIALASPAAAQSIPSLPNIPAVPDFCVWGSCIQFTHSSFLTSLQQLTTQNSMLQGVMRNLGSFGSFAQGAISKEIQAMTGPPTDSAPNGAAVAAQALATQAPLSAATLSQIDADAKAADGTQQQEQVNNMYQSRIAAGIEKANTLAAQQEIEKQTQDQQTSDGLTTMFSGAINPDYRL